MAVKVLMNCKKCNAETEHWDNRQGKKNPKAPDYKCSLCGNGVWSSKKEESKPSPKPVVNGRDQHNTDRNMCIISAKDIVLSDKRELTSFEKVRDTLKYAWILYHGLECVKSNDSVSLDSYLKVSEEFINEE